MRGFEAVLKWIRRDPESAIRSYLATHPMAGGAGGEAAVFAQIIIGAEMSPGGSVAPGVFVMSPPPVLAATGGMKITNNVILNWGFLNFVNAAAGLTTGAVQTWSLPFATAVYNVHVTVDFNGLAFGATQSATASPSSVTLTTFAPQLLMAAAAPAGTTIVRFIAIGS